VLTILAGTACIEDRLSVELFTQIHADGSCTRRVEYRLERVDTEKGDARVAISPDKDPLRTLHRFPSGEPWQVREETDTGLHVLVVEATLPSPNAIEGDYFRARARKAPPARNAVSANVDPEHEYYEYQEVLRDPASPLAGARLLSRIAMKRDEDFARRFADALADEGGAPRDSDLRRLFRDRFAAPFAREVALVGERPFYGPRERRELDVILNGLDEKQKDLASRVAALVPATPSEKVTAAVDDTLNRLGEEVLPEVEAAGLLLSVPDGNARLRFRATLVMPAPILRANACVTGDTVVWEFEEEDLFGRGFEMKALASAR
jgi:hypothetical protein